VLLTGGVLLAVELGIGVPGPLREVADILPPWALVLGVLAPDAVLTLFTLLVTRRWRDLLVAPAFPVVRMLDALACVRALLAALLPQVGGVWSSPPRRPAGAATPEAR
jgi:poly-beta-1,6-N-acetyl-D-glucosamine synthase